MEENNFILDLLGALDQAKSQKQINEDIKQLEKTINMLRITGTFARGNTKKELNAYIKSLQSQLNYVKLNAKIDDKNLKRGIDSALNKVSFKDIDALKIDGSKTKLKLRKVIADTKEFVEKNPISVGINYENRRNKLDNDLTTYLNRNTKIEESATLLKEAENVRTLIGAINDKKSLREATDAFQLYKSSVASVGFNTKSTTDKIKDMFGHITKLGSLFSVTSFAVNNFTKSLGTLKNIDDILTEISKTSDLTAQELEKLGNTSFKSASKYGKTASDYLTGIQEMSRSGFYGEKGTAMAEQSLLAQAAGDLSADVANKYILATNAAYKYNGEVSKLNAVLDGQNSITNRNSVSMEDMATAMSKAGTVASSYRVSIEDLSAMIGTMESVTKLDGSEIGNGIKAILINLQNITSSKIKDTLDAANASMTEFVNGTEKLRDPISILRDLAVTFNQLDEDDALRAEILTNIGGKYQAAKLAALLQNMTIFDKILVDYSEGAGSAMEEAMKSANNWSGKLNQLQNSWDSLVSSITNKDAVLGGLTFGDRLIQGLEGVIDKFGVIPTMLTAINSSMVAMKKDYGITKIWDKENQKIDIEGNIFGIDISKIKELKKHYGEAGDAIAIWNNKLKGGKADIEKFNYSVVQNNMSLKDYLSTTSKDAPASLKGYKTYLQQTGLATEDLRLKTILLNTALTLLGSIAIQAVITGIANAFDKFNETVEESKEKVGGINSKISDLKAQLEDLNGLEYKSEFDKQKISQLERELELQEKILEVEQKRLYQNQIGTRFSDYFDADSLVAKQQTENDRNNQDRYSNLSRWSRTYESSLNDIDAEWDSLQEKLNSEDLIGHNRFVTEGRIAELTEKRNELLEKQQTIEDQLTLNMGEYLKNYQTAQEAVGSGLLTGSDLEKAESMAEYWNQLYQDSSEIVTNIQKMNGTYDNTNDLLEGMFGGISQEDLSSLSDDDKRIALSFDPDNVIGFEELQQKIAETKGDIVDLNETELSTFEDAWADSFTSENDAVKELGDNLIGLAEKGRLTTEAFELADSNAGSYFKNLGISADEAVDKINKMVDESDQLSSMSKAIFQMSEALAAKAENGFASADVLSGFDVEIKSMESWDEFQSILGSTTSSYQQCEDAAKNLAIEWMNSGNFLSQLTEQNRAYYQTQLESMGITNAEEIVTDALTQKELELVATKQYLAQTSEELANATASEIAQFGTEQVAAGTCSQELALFYLKKALINQTTITTAGDCSNILALAKAADIGVEHLERLNTLMNLITKRDSAHASGDARAVSELNRAIAEFSDNVVSDLNLEDIKVDFSGIGNSAKSAAKETEKEVDIMAELNSEMDKLQSAYESLCDIRDTYNKYGKITVDQYQELTDMGFNFLANLVDENGELGLNASAFERLSHAKLQEMQIQMARNAIDTINGLQSEVEATEYLTYANENLRDAALSATEALLYQAQAAAHLRGEQQGLAADQIVQGYEASKMLASKVDFTFDPNETEKAAKEDKTDELLDAYNNEKKLLEHLLAMDQISKQEYYDRLMSLVYKYFDGDEEHKDQIWDVEESYHAYLESIKETYNWIEVFLNALAKKTSALIDKAEKFISWSKKNAMINRAVKATDREIKGQTNAYAYYAEQARKVKLPNGYISKIQNGTLTMEDMQNEALSDKIEKYQEWYDKMTECQDAVSALYDQERDLIKQKLDNVLDHYDSLDNYMSSIVSKMDSFISLMDDMGKRSSLTDLLEQFAAANEQLSHFQSRSENIQIEKEDTRFDSSKKVAEAKERDKQGSIDELNRQKDALTSVQDTGTYKKLLKEIEKAEAAYDKQYEKLWAIDPEKDPDGKKWDAAQKKLNKLSDKLSDLVNKKDELLANATADNVVEYAKVYDAYMKLYNKQLSLEEKGKELSQKDQDKMEALFGQMLEMDDYRRNAIKELEEQIGRLNGTVADDTEAEKIREQLSGIGSGVKDSATYKNLEKDIEAVQAKIDRFWETHDEATNAQQRQLDKWEAQLEAYYEKQNQLEDNATAETIGQYAKIYDAWKKLQDKIDAGKVLSTKEWKAYNEYGAQLEQFAEERASAEKDLYDQLEKALNPGDKIAVIEREYEEAAEGIYESYQRQIDDIKKSMTDSQQYKDLLAKTQNLEDIRDTKGLTAKQEAQLQKYKAELEALENGATGDNISAYIKTWEKWYALQQKLDSGKKLSATEAANYDALKAQLDAWDKEKQEQISDLIDLMNDDLEKLRETNAENIAEAESEINSYYSNIYGLAKKIAEYNITALGEQLSYLDAYISYYKELVSLYDSFSGDKLSKLLTDLDEDVTTGQTEIYEKYLKTLEKKYDATLSQINEYRQLIDAVDTNDFQGSMDLFQKAMDDYNAAGNTEMAEKLKAVLDVLNERAVDADNWEEYADLWLNEWEQALADGKAELIGTAGAIQEVNDALREIRFSDITDALEELTKANEILSSMEGLIQEKWLYDKDGITEYGRAKAALLVSQLENAQTAAEQYLELYNKIIDNKDTYASEKAYKEALNEAIKNYYASINDAASLEESIMDLMKKSQEQELSSLKDIIEARKDALQKKKEYYDYSKKVSDSQKEIDSIKAQIDALENLSDATDAATKAKLAQLKADLEEKEEALKETKDEHTYSLQIDALDELADTLTDALDDSTKSVEEILKDQKETVEATKDMCQTSIDSVNETMDKIAAFYKSMGMSIDGIDLTLNGRGSLGTDVITVDAGTNGAATAGTKNDIVEAVNETTEAVLDIDKLIADGEWTLVPDNVIYGMDGKTYEMPDWNTMPKLNYDVEKMFPTEFLKQQQVVNQPVVNIHYDNMINVEGNVDEKVAKLLPQQLQQSYDYIINKMRYDVKLSGGRPIRFLG